MVLKKGIKRTRDLGMLRPSRADLAAEAVLASLNCTRAWRHKTLFRRYHPDLSQKKMEKQILPGMAWRYGHLHIQRNRIWWPAEG
jgi:hypothetical protein